MVPLLVHWSNCNGQIFEDIIKQIRKCCAVEAQRKKMVSSERPIFMLLHGHKSVIIGPAIGLAQAIGVVAADRGETRS
uniref:Uncharacterized protein n=1 Tax=Parascaris equorum TaxID=6256 RepID=A0A914RGY5_PAREQ